VKKVSREGIVLIKSFEGFRPRAAARPEGGWIIGYGHTLSAREGASVSEADAELLLRYDLLAVEKRLNETAAGALNQHQFDALASFAFSVGLDRFDTSDVLSRLTSGDQGAAAEAMLAWPESRSPSVGARRRAAERALFTADPSRPVALADLLAAPIMDAVDPLTSTEEGGHLVDAPPPVTEQAQAPETVESSVIASENIEDRLVEPEPAVEPRVAAVAALLGEADLSSDDPGAVPVVPRFETSAPASQAAPQPASSVDGKATQADSLGSKETTDQSEAEATSDAQTDLTPAEIIVPQTQTAQAEATDIRDGFSTGPVGGHPGSTLALHAQRYSPYGAAIVGPLPFLPPSTLAPATAPSEPTTPVEPTASVESLILTPPEEMQASVLRPAWTTEERVEIEATPAGESLFGEDLGLTQGGQPLGRPDFEPDAPQRFDWSETGAFIVMGAVGLTAFGASMAAFRLASEQGGGDETSIIGWVLAVIGVACVGVSSFNLYRKFGLAGSDR
jgi:lysozyme